MGRQKRCTLLHFEGSNTVDCRVGIWFNGVREWVQAIRGLDLPSIIYSPHLFEWLRPRRLVYDWQRRVRILPASEQAIQFSGDIVMMAQDRIHAGQGGGFGWIAGGPTAGHDQARTIPDVGIARDGMDRLFAIKRQSDHPPHRLAALAGGLHRDAARDERSAGRPDRRRCACKPRDAAAWRSARSRSD